MIRVRQPERRHHRRVHDAVNVSLADGGVARVKVVVGNFSVEHANVFVEIAVDRGAQFLRRDFALQRDTCDLAFSVYAGVSASRAVNVDALSFKQRQRAFEFSLNRSESLLRLPPVKVRAVVLKRSEEHTSELQSRGLIS